MHWSSYGWFLGSKRWSKNSHVASVLSQSHGRWSGMLRGTPPLLGTYVHATWTSRNESQLGAFKLAATDFELGALALQSPQSTQFLMGMCEAVIHWSPERDPIAYRLFHEQISAILKNPTPELLDKFLRAILREFWDTDRKGPVLEITQSLSLPQIKICKSLLQSFSTP